MAVLYQGYKGYHGILQDIQLRKNNVILRGLPVAVQTNDPLSTARSFLVKCGNEQYDYHGYHGYQGYHAYQGYHG